jgi:RNase P/RNase MRP subunit p30
MKYLIFISIKYHYLIFCCKGLQDPYELWMMKYLEDVLNWLGFTIAK